MPFKKIQIHLFPSSLSVKQAGFLSIGKATSLKKEQLLIQNSFTPLKNCHILTVTKDLGSYIIVLVIRSNCSNLPGQRALEYLAEPLPKMSMTINLIWRQGYSSWNIGSIEYPFIGITPRSTLIRSGRICLGPIYGTNRSLWALFSFRRNNWCHIIKIKNSYLKLLLFTKNYFSLLKPCICVDKTTIIR